MERFASARHNDRRIAGVMVAGQKAQDTIVWMM
jgi:hypothetical protein